jgi:hypothetical protein
VTIPARQERRLSLRAVPLVGGDGGSWIQKQSDVKTTARTISVTDFCVQIPTEGPCRI